MGRSSSRGGDHHRSGSRSDHGSRGRSGSRKSSRSVSSRKSTTHSKSGAAKSEDAKSGFDMQNLTSIKSQVNKSTQQNANDVAPRGNAISPHVSLQFQSGQPITSTFLSRANTSSSGQPITSTFLSRANTPPPRANTPPKAKSAPTERARLLRYVLLSTLFVIFPSASSCIYFTV